MHGINKSKPLCSFGIVLYLLAISEGFSIGEVRVFCFIPFNIILNAFPYIVLISLYFRLEFQFYIGLGTGRNVTLLDGWYIAL
jgi:hypothetical protein